MGCFGVISLGRQSTNWNAVVLYEEYIPTILK